MSNVADFEASKTITSRPGNNPNKLSKTVLDGPAQPNVNVVFKKTLFGNFSRSFGSVWYKTFRWIEY